MRFFSSLAALVLLAVSACTNEQAPAALTPYSSVSFYFCAHPDDCLLFMNPNLYEDVTTQNNKVVSVYFTSGDAGRGTEPNAKKTPYYRAREIGAIATNRWMADADDHDPIPTSGEMHVNINGKSIAMYHYKNTTTYFLRLPDGMYHGEGSEGTNFQSLAHLKSGASPADAIDKTARYNNWAELVATVDALIKKESSGISRVAVNVTDIDTGVNIGDHSDHTFGGMAVMDAIKPYSCIAVARFENYISASKPTNLAGRGLYAEIGSFAVMTAAYGQELYDNSWDDAHRVDLGRNYFSFQNTHEACAF